MGAEFAGGAHAGDHQALRTGPLIEPLDADDNKGEANLPKKSVVNISQIFRVNKSDLSEKMELCPKIVFFKFCRVLSFLQSLKRLIKRLLILQLTFHHT